MTTSAPLSVDEISISSDGNTATIAARDISISAPLWARDGGDMPTAAGTGAVDVRFSRLPGELARALHPDDYPVRASDGVRLWGCPGPIAEATERAVCEALRRHAAH